MGEQPKLCDCGCGQPTNPVPQTIRSRGYKRGEYRRFVMGHNTRLAGQEIHEDPETHCWIWQLAIATHGYGAYAIGRRVARAHRVYYEDLVGLIPPGLELDHLCRTPACVNPGHLEPVTHAENMRRSRRAACRRGHPFTQESTATRSSGKRECRICANARARERYARKVGKT